jgi:hypothetical protein
LRLFAAILLWGILLFNWVGYRVLNSFMQDKADLQLEAQLDRCQYDESQLLSIKVPVAQLAYYNNSPVFERVDGQIEIGGIPYQYVKRRIYNDSLEVLCIPNRAALKLRLSRDDYFKLVNDIQRSQGQHPGSHPASFKGTIADPYTVTNSFQLGSPPFRVIKRAYYFLVSFHSIPGSTDDRPPALTA